MADHPVGTQAAVHCERGAAASHGIDLNFRPRLPETIVLGLDPDAALVASGDPLPRACACVVRQASGDDVEDAVLSERELTQWTHQGLDAGTAGTPLGEKRENWFGVAVNFFSGVMFDDQLDLADIAVAASLPAGNFNDPEPCFAQDTGHPCKRVCQNPVLGVAGVGSVTGGSSTGTTGGIGKSAGKAAVPAAVDAAKAAVFASNASSAAVTSGGMSA